MFKLTKVEEEIMHIVWDLRKCMVTEIIEQLPDNPPHSTISSVMRILDKKGFVGHKKYGRTHEYFPLVSKEDYSKGSITQLVANYFNGSMNSLVSFLIEKDEISESELIKMIDDLKSKSQKK